jgi:hypothetical protein
MRVAWGLTRGNENYISNSQEKLQHIQNGRHIATQSTLLADSVGWFCGATVVVGGSEAE